MKIVHGDLFESEMQTLTNAVNCIGVMGAGIALGFANRFPKMLRDYEEKCAFDEVKLDEPYCFDEGEKKILNFPTMYYPGEEADLDQILRGFDHVVDYFEEWGITSIAIPALGCGIGGLLFDDIKEPIIEYLEEMDIPAELYAPNERAALFPYNP